MAEPPKSGGIGADSTLTNSELAPEGGARHEIVAGSVVAERYEIVRLIAHGGMGAVYEAQDLSLRERVALKTIRSERASDARAVERFKQEALLARRVTHKNVCRVFDVGYHADEMFLTMELLDGETLSARIKRGRLTPEEALPLVEQMVAALAAAHHAGVVHRDFKCSNVMLAGGRVVVTDFGLAHDATAADHDRSRDGFLGSPAYVAPEQVGGRQVSFATDVYALGVVLFEMLTGQLPFVGATPMATATMRLSEAPPSPRAIVRTLPANWERVILRCLEREPADRFASVEDVLLALASKSVAPPSARRRLRRRLPLVVAALVVGLGVAGAFGWRALRHRGTVAGAMVDGRRTIAVSDLEDRSGRPDSGWRATAFSELLAAQLDGGEALRVLPRAAVEGRDRAQLVRQGATLALGGSVRQSGETLTFAVEIVEAGSGRTVAAAEESGPSTELFDIAARTAARLRQSLGLPALSPAEATRTRSALPANPEAARRYTEGLTALRRFQFAAAQRDFEGALAAEPDQPMVYSALATTWHQLESEERERKAAERAFELSANLPRQERLSIEAAYREALKDWPGAAQIRLTLATFFPENLEYGLELVDAQRRAGRVDDALATLERLRRLPRPDGDDPRIDVSEATVRQRKDTKGALAAVKRAADAAHARGAVGVEADARILECGIQSAGMHIEAAQPACDAAVRLFTAEGNQAGVARATLAQAQLNITARHPDLVQKYSQAALALYREIGSRGGEVNVKQVLAIAYKRSGDLAAAQRLWEEAIDYSRDAGEPALMVRAMGDLASAYTEEGRHAEAIPLYRQVIENAHAHGLSNLEANTKSNLSMSLVHRGELADARRNAEGAVELWRKLGQKNDVTFGLDAMEQIALRQGRLADGRAIEEEALATRESLGWIGGPSRQNLAELAMAEGDLVRAETLGRKAVEEFRAQNERPGEVFALDVLVRILVQAGHLDDAAKAVARETELQAQTGLGLISVVGSQSLVKAARGDVDGAVAALRAAVAESVRTNDVDSEIDQRQLLATVLGRHGKRPEARRELALLERVARAHGYNLALRDAAALEREFKGAR